MVKIILVSLFLFGVNAFAQTKNEAEEITLRDIQVYLYPQARNYRRGPKTDFKKITIKNGEVSAIITMHSLGLNGCRAENVPSSGKIDGNTIFLQIVVSESDFSTCRISYNITINEKKEFLSGNFQGEVTGGILKID